MPHNTKEKRNAYRRDYMKKYRPANLDKFRSYEKTYLADPVNLQNKKEKRKLRAAQPDVLLKQAEIARLRRQKRFNEWASYFPEITSCECCGVQISFLERPDMGQIHFDHRLGGVELISKGPRHWLRNRRCTPENITIWESCDFGMLCLECNSKLPTKGRIEFLENALRYARGER